MKVPNIFSLPIRMSLFQYFVDVVHIYVPHFQIYPQCNKHIYIYEKFTFLYKNIFPIIHKTNQFVFFV